MQEIRIAKVNRMEVPVLISDEKEALLAAKAAGRAIVGLWRPGMDMDMVSPARYVVEDLDDVTERFLERTARRHMGLPWKICETKRLVIRELFGDDFDEVWDNQVGRGFGSLEEFLSYTKHQYSFYEFGIWALVHKETGELAGVAGLKVPEACPDMAAGTGDDAGLEVFERPGCGVAVEAEDALGAAAGSGAAGAATEAGAAAGALGAADALPALTLELGYHIFPAFRRQGYGRESCEAILRYGEEELGAARFLVRIAKENEASKRLAASLGFRKCHCGR